jgi:hypothetical protein
MPKKKPDELTHEEAIQAVQELLADNGSKAKEAKVLKDNLEASLQEVAALRQNQQMLIGENNQLRERATTAESMDGKLIYKKMLNVQSGLKAIGKDQKNPTQGWSFRGIDDFMNALKPLLDKERVFILPETLQATEPKIEPNGRGKLTKFSNIIMKYTFTAEDGSNVFATVPAEAQDFGDKGIAKALSAAFKYAAMQVFCVPTEDIAEGDKDIVELGTASETPKVEATPELPAAPAASAPVVTPTTGPAKKVFKRKSTGKKTTKKATTTGATLKKKTFSKGAVTGA